MIGEDPYAGAAQPGAATGPGRRSGPAVPTRQAAPPAAAGAAGNLVDVLFRAHALTLVRMALLLVGDQSSAEDVVQGAFLGLCRNVSRLRDPVKALPYLRASVLNGCRSVLRARGRARQRRVPHDPPVWSAESAALSRGDRRAVLAAAARLPRRQREVVALRYYLDLTDQEIAETLRVSRGTVSSTASRALAALARDLGEEPLTGLRNGCAMLLPQPRPPSGKRRSAARKADRQRVQRTELRLRGDSLHVIVVSTSRVNGFRIGSLRFRNGCP